MVQHVSIRSESISLMIANLDAKNTGGDHHTELTVLYEWEFSELWNLITDQIIVSLDIFNFLIDLILKRAAFQ